MLMPSRRLFLGGLLSALAAPAIVRAANIMPVRSLIILPNPTFSSFDKLMPDGMQYQWASDIACGVSYGEWKPVPPSRFNKQFAVSGDQIEVGGMILMECPKVYYDSVRAAEIERAHLLNRQWAQKAMGDGLSGHYIIRSI